MRSKRDVEAGLLNKGFRQNNSHHRYFVYHTIKGEKSRIRTKTSHGAKDLDPYLIGQMAKQCGLTSRGFLRLVDCPLSQKEYERKVSSRL